jgi:hypothetical protein
MINDEILMTNDERNPNDEGRSASFELRHSFVIRH